MDAACAGGEKLPWVDSSTPALTTRSALWLLALAPLALLRILGAVLVLWTYSLFVLAMSVGYEPPPAGDDFLPKLHSYGLIKRSAEVVSGCSPRPC